MSAHRHRHRVAGYTPNPDAPWPLFGCDDGWIRGVCPHHGPLPVWSRGVCMVCHKTGANLEHKLRIALIAEQSRTAEKDAQRQRDYLIALRQRRLARLKRGA